jgi:hypothetical protein
MGVTRRKVNQKSFEPFSISLDRASQDDALRSSPAGFEPARAPISSACR